MISHVHLGVADFERSSAFYKPLMAELGLLLKFSDAAKAWAGWVAPDAPRPLFLIGKPFDGAAAAPGNGQMVALLAPTRASVDHAHALALSLGAACEGAPGLRPQYHPDYYGAYFRDPDGNKLCVCCHDAEAGS
ncbi:VOC family protein [Roseateles sp.]|uniref:VOC family protein n=1 Tax=Roseateles sp. TaxID=1971397 RepID=UPI00286BD3A9|nr:VOC family protein [Roseateles sp.]